MSLTVCTVNYYAQRYIAFQELTYRRLADDKNFKRIICNTTPDNAEAEALSKMPNTKFFASSSEGLTGSEEHGYGLNEILPLIDTKYAVFADPDTAALMPGWDTACIEALGDNCIAIGSPYHSSYVDRYQNFPNAIFFFFDVEKLRELNVDLRPPRYRFRTIRKRLSKRIPLLKMFSNEQDTGWRLPGAFEHAGYTASIFDFIRRDDSQSIVLAPDARGDEYHWQGKPIITHQGRGALSRTYNVDEVSQLWLNKVSSYLDLDSQVLDEIASD